MYLSEKTIGNKNKYRIGKTFISITKPQHAQRKIIEMVNDGVKGYICVSNPRTVVYASKHEDYLKVMDNSLMNLPDAEPILWAARLWGLKNVQRTMGPLLFREMISHHENGLRHFLLGDTNDTLKKVTQKFTEEMKANIVGSYSPPFCGLDEYDYTEIARIINDSKADIVWVSMRAPKQDFFATRLLPYLDKKICIGVGAAFRFSIGEYKMAPPIIKKLGLMGLYWGSKGRGWFRFLKSYITITSLFLWYLMKIPFKRLLGKKYYI